MIEEYGWADPEGDVKLGSCCNCGQQNTVQNILFIDRKSPEPGVGCWGCIVCDLPQAGAVAVLCDECMAGSEGYPQHVCLGSPAENRRIPFSELSAEPFQHDMAKHANEEESAVPVTFPEEIAGRVADLVDRISTEIERDTKRRERHQRN